MARGRTLAAAAALAVAGATMVGTSAQADPAPDYEKITVDSQSIGSAFVVSGNLADNPRPELVVSAFGQFGFGPGGPVPPPAGTVTMYKNAQPGNAPNGQLANWDKTSIVKLSDGITIPNRALIANVDGGGKPDVIVPGGYFFDTYRGPGAPLAPTGRGSITWWESSGNAKKWTRHNVVLGSRFAYHSAVYFDADNDGLKDILSVGEEAGNPQSADDDVVELHMFKGTGGGNFAPAVKLADGGGALIETHDVDGDGDTDVLSPQFFGQVAGQPFVPSFARGASVASFVWFQNNGDGSFTRHAIGTNQGPSFSLIAVENFRGDGVTRYVGTNHTNKNIAFPPFALYPEPAVYEFTPGANPTAPWSVVQLSTPLSFPVTGGAGQASPGAAAVGDLDGDNLNDVAVSGDGSRAVYWLQQQADGSFVTRQFPDSTGFGQAGGPVVEDLNRSGTNEVVFSSFDQNTVAIWAR